jgi:Cys-tRNA(Pro)/Cys-tRNA(Cys) deacylase
MSGPPKTNAVRILESLGIAYELATYPVGEGHADAVEVARSLGVPAELVFKTLVTRDEGARVLVFCVPAAAELELRKAARAAGTKRVELVPLRDLKPLTGYARGGCSPIGMRQRYPVIVDETATLYPRIYVNAGSRGLQAVLAPGDLARATGAAFADIC